MGRRPTYSRHDMLPEQHRGNKFFDSLVDEIHGEEKSDTGSVENNKPLVRIQSVLNGPLADCKIELLRKLGLPLHSDTYQGGDLSKDFVLAIKIAQLQEEQLKKIELEPHVSLMLDSANDEARSVPEHYVHASIIAQTLLIDHVSLSAATATERDLIDAATRLGNWHVEKFVGIMLGSDVDQGDFDQFKDVVLEGIRDMYSANPILRPGATRVNDAGSADVVDLQLKPNELPPGEPPPLETRDFKRGDRLASSDLFTDPYQNEAKDSEAVDFDVGDILDVKHLIKGSKSLSVYDQVFAAATRLQCLYRGHRSRADTKRSIKAKAVMVLCRWWRKKRKQREGKRQLRGIVTFQAAVRGRIVRRQRVMKHIMATNKRFLDISRELNNAAGSIQCIARGFLVRKRIKEAMKAKAIVAQAIVFYERTLNAAALIQFRFRGYAKRKRSKRNQSATAIQARFRGYCGRRTAKRLHAAISIQAAVRGYMERKKAQQLMEIVNLAQIQAATQEREKAQLRYMELQALEEESIIKNLFTAISNRQSEEEDRQMDILVLTCQNRTQYAARLIQHNFRIVRSRRRSVHLIQRFFRGFVVRRYLSGWHFYAQIIQRAWNSYTLFKKLRRMIVKRKLKKRAERYAEFTPKRVLSVQYVVRRFLKKVHRVIRLQSIFRMFMHTLNLKKLRQAMPIIRRAWRIYKFKRLLWGFRQRITKIQSAFRRVQAQKRYNTVQHSLIVLQSFARRNAALHLYREIQHATVKLQSLWRRYSAFRCISLMRTLRMFLLTKLLHRRYLRKRRSAILIEKNVRMWEARRLIKRWNDSAVRIQTIYRMYMPSKYYGLLTLAVPLFQQSFRSRFPASKFLKCIEPLLAFVRARRRRYWKRRKREERQVRIGRIIVLQSCARRLLSNLSLWKCHPATKQYHLDRTIPATVLALGRSPDSFGDDDVTREGCIYDVVAHDGTRYYGVQYSDLRAYCTSSFRGKRYYRSEPGVHALNIQFIQPLYLVRLKTQETCFFKLAERYKKLFRVKELIILLQSCVRASQTQFFFRKLLKSTVILQAYFRSILCRRGISDTLEVREGFAGQLEKIEHSDHPGIPRFDIRLDSGRCFTSVPLSALSFDAKGDEISNSRQVFDRIKYFPHKNYVRNIVSFCSERSEGRARIASMIKLSVSLQALQRAVTARAIFKKVIRSILLIQSLMQRRLKKVVQSVLMIQTQMRLFTARRQYLKWKHVASHIATFFQKHYRGHKSRVALSNYYKRLKTLYGKVALKKQEGAARGYNALVLQKNKKAAAKKIVSWLSRKQETKYFQKWEKNTPRLGQAVFHPEEEIHGNKRRESCAILIQAWFRMMLAKSQYTGRRRKMILFQSFIRGYIVRANLHNYVLVDANRKRAKTRALKRAQKREVKLNQMAVLIQKCFRAYVARKFANTLKGSLIKMSEKLFWLVPLHQNSLVTLQSLFRGVFARRKIARNIKLQSSIHRRQFYRKFWHCSFYSPARIAITKFQSIVRMKYFKGKYQKFLELVIVAQTQLRKHVKKRIGSVLAIQSFWRGYYTRNYLWKHTIYSETFAFQKFFPGNIVKRKGSSRFLIKMDHGPTKVFHADRIRENPQIIYRVGDRCEMTSHDWQDFFPGTIYKIDPDFTYDVLLDDGELYHRLTFDQLKPHIPRDLNVGDDVDVTFDYREQPKPGVILDVKEQGEEDYYSIKLKDGDHVVDDVKGYRIRRRYSIKEGSGVKATSSAPEWYFKDKRGFVVDYSDKDDFYVQFNDDMTKLHCSYLEDIRAEHSQSFEVGTRVALSQRHGKTDGLAIAVIKRFFNLNGIYAVETISDNKILQVFGGDILYKIRDDWEPLQRVVVQHPKATFVEALMFQRLAAIKYMKQTMARILFGKRVRRWLQARKLYYQGFIVPFVEYLWLKFHDNLAGELGATEMAELISSVSGEDMSVEECTKILKFIDSDGNASIDRGELVNFITHGLTLSNVDKKRFKSSGDPTQEVLLKFFDGIASELKSFSSKSRQPVNMDELNKSRVWIAKYLDSIWIYYDEENTGELNPFQAKLFLEKTLERDDISEENIQTMIHQIDGDSDGSVSKSELLQYIAHGTLMNAHQRHEYGLRGPLQAIMVSFFEHVQKNIAALADREEELENNKVLISKYLDSIWLEYDQENSGELNPFQAKSLLGETLERDDITEENFRSMIHQIDGGNDGSISKSELLNYIAYGMLLKSQERHAFALQSGLHAIMVSFFDHVQENIEKMVGGTAEFSYKFANFSVNSRVQAYLEQFDGAYYGLVVSQDRVTGECRIFFEDDYKVHECPASHVSAAPWDPVTGNRLDVGTKVLATVYGWDGNFYVGNIEEQNSKTGWYLIRFEDGTREYCSPFLVEKESEDAVKEEETRDKTGSV